jgi:microcystin-dependent protein
MSDPFVAEIRIFPFNFAPKGWAFCDGQILPLSQNTALFSLLGTTYGGDGRSNFALPDLQGSVPMHPGQGPGLSLHDLGETGGSDTITLLQSELPIHAHSLMATNTSATSAAPGNGVLAMPSRQVGPVRIGENLYVDPTVDTSATVQLDPRALAAAGGDQPHNNLQPYLTINFCIALQGVYPPRT